MSRRDHAVFVERVGELVAGVARHLALELAVGGGYVVEPGMYGVILVEPEEGLPEVDHEFYSGQIELYTTGDTGEDGHHEFDFDEMADEDPTYVVLNGEKYAITPDGHGAISAEVGDTARIIFGVGGPNLTSAFHPIGSVWDRVYLHGSVTSEPWEYVETMPVAPGTATVAEMHFPVPGPVNLVDHALSRVAREGALAVIDVEGEEDPNFYDGAPDF